MRRAARRDATEPAILAALRQVGAEYILLDAFDVLVLFRRQVFMLDCKTGRGKATVSQARLKAAGWPLRFVRTAEEALAAIGVGR